MRSGLGHNNTFHFSSLAIHMPICWYAWDHCHVAWPNFGPTYAAGQMVSHKVKFIIVLMPASFPGPVATNHYFSNNILDSWYKVLLVICYVCLVPALRITTKQQHFGIICLKDIVPDLLWFVQMQLCKPSLQVMLFYWNYRERDFS